MAFAKGETDFLQQYKTWNYMPQRKPPGNIRRQQKIGRFNIKERGAQSEF